MEQLNIFIADDHQLFVEGLTCALGNYSSPSFSITGTASGKEGLMNSHGVARAQVLLLDLNLGEDDGLDLLKGLKAHYTGLRILILTMYDDKKLVRKAEKRGANGYILKNASLGELAKDIEQVVACDDFFAGDGLDDSRGGRNSDNGCADSEYADRFVRKHQLTKREMEVLHLIAQALSNKQIAGELFISDQTVSVHRKNIMRKLGVSNTAGLIKMAYDNSLV